MKKLKQDIFMLILAIYLILLGILGALMLIALSMGVFEKIGVLVFDVVMPLALSFVIFVTIAFFMDIETYDGKKQGDKN